MINFIKADIYYRKAVKEADRGFYGKSIHFYDKSIALSKEKFGLYLNKSLALSKIGKYDEAINYLRETINNNPKNFCNYLYLGIVNYEKCEFNDALKYFKKSLCLSKENLLPLFYISLINIQLNSKVKESINFLYEKIQFSNPEFKSHLLVFLEKKLFESKKSLSYNQTVFKEKYLNYKTTVSKNLLMFLFDTFYTVAVSIKKFISVEYKFFEEKQNSAIQNLTEGKIDKAISDLIEIFDSNIDASKVFDLFLDSCLFINQTDLMKS